MTPPAVRRADPAPRSVLRPVLTAAFFLSGAAALADESLWVRGLGLVFGTAAPAVSATLTLFLGGLGLGAAVFGRVADRVASPIRLLAVLELGASVLVALTPAEFRLAGGFVALGGEAPGPFAWFAMRFVAGAAILLPPTILMGGTLPAIARWFVRREEEVAAGVGRLYAWNTVGGAVGALLAAHLLIEHLGPTRGLYAAASLHAAVGVLFLTLARWAMDEENDGREGSMDVRAVGARAQPKASAPQSALLARVPGTSYGVVSDVRGGPRRSPLPRAAVPSRAFVLVAAFLTGLSALALEFCWTRILALVLGSSAYAFAAILAVTLIGLALGGWLIPRLARAHLSGALAGAAIAAAALIFISHPLLDDLPEMYVRAFPAFRGSSWGLTLLALGIASAGLLLPAAAMGGTFPVLVSLAGEGLSVLGGRVGLVYGWNTLGAVLGAPLAAFALIPRIGMERTVGLSGAAYLAVGLAALSSRRMAALGLAGAAAGVLIAWTLPPWDTERLMSGPFVYAADYIRRSPVPGVDQTEVMRDRMVQGDLVFYREGATANVSVRRQGGLLSLRINGKTDASTGGDLETQILIGHLPLLLHPAPRQVLVVGLGSGITLGAVAQHPVERVDLVELSPEVVAAARYFSEHNHRVLDDPRVRLVVNDGRNYLLATQRRYDVITSQPTNPWITGSGNLFTREYFRLCRERLAPGGLALHWLQLYNIRPGDAWTSIRAFRSVFPHVQAWITLSGLDLLLIGSEAQLPMNPSRIEERLAWRPVRDDLARVSLDRASRILGAYLTDEQGLDAAMSGGPVHSDDNPVFEFAAARALQAYTAHEMFAWLGRIPRLDPLRRLYSEGRLALASGDPVRAAALWEQALALDPGYASVRWQVANAWWQAGLFYAAKGDARAEASFRKAYAINSQHFAALTDLGIFYLRGGRRKEAEQAIRAALRISPTHPRALRALASMGVVP